MYPFLKMDKMYSLMNFDKCIPMYNHHYQCDRDTERIHHLPKLPCATLVNLHVSRLSHK